MELRSLISILVFVSAYSPLAIIVAIQDFNFCAFEFKNPEIICYFLGTAILSCLILCVTIKHMRSLPSPVEITSYSNKSSELVQYSIPYLVSFFAADMGNINTLLSFIFFMIMMYIFSVKSSSVFINPILLLLGYRLYEVNYSQNMQEYTDIFLVKDGVLSEDKMYFIAQLSENLYFVVTDKEENNE